MIKAGQNVSIAAPSEDTNTHMVRNKIKTSWNWEKNGGTSVDRAGVQFDPVDGWPTHIPSALTGVTIRLFNYYDPQPAPFTGNHILVKSGVGTYRVVWNNVDLSVNTTIRGDEFYVPEESGQMKIQIFTTDNTNPLRFELYHEDDYDLADNRISSQFWRTLHKDTPVIRMMVPTGTNFLQDRYANNSYDWDREHYTYVGSYLNPQYMPVSTGFKITEELYDQYGNTDSWVNVPANISDFHFLNLANQIANSSIPLVYLELGNEWWHSSSRFQCFAHALAGARALWGDYVVQLDGNNNIIDNANNGYVLSNADLDTYWGGNMAAANRDVGTPIYSESQAAYQWIVLRTHELMQLGSSVSGFDSKTKWIMGINGAFGRHFTTIKNVDLLRNNHPGGNTIWNEFVQQLDYISPAHYISSTRFQSKYGRQPTTIDEALTWAWSHAMTIQNSIKNNLNSAQAVPQPGANINVIIYEGGMSLIPKDNKDLAQIQLYWDACLDEQVYTLYMDMFKFCANNNIPAICVFNDTSSFGTARYGSWGTIHVPTQGWDSTPRGRAFIDYNATGYQANSSANTPPPPVANTPPANTGPTPANSSVVLIRASSRLYNGGANMKVVIDSTQYANLEITADRWNGEIQNVVFYPSPELDGTENFQIIYDNDISDSGGNRNLFIHSIKIDGNTQPLDTLTVTAADWSYNDSLLILYIGTNGVAEWNPANTPPPANNYTVSNVNMIVSGRQYEMIGPRVRVVKGSNTLIDVFVDAERWQDEYQNVVFQVSPALTGSENIKIVYSNDDFEPGGTFRENRNLFVNKFIVDGSPWDLRDVVITAADHRYFNDNGNTDILASGIFMGTNGFIEWNPIYKARGRYTKPSNTRRPISFGGSVQTPISKTGNNLFHSSLFRATVLNRPVKISIYEEDGVTLIGSTTLLPNQDYQIKKRPLQIVATSNNTTLRATKMK